MNLQDDEDQKVVFIDQKMKAIEALFQSYSLSYVSKLTVVTELSKAIHSLQLESSTSLFLELLNKYVRALINKKNITIRLCELVLPFYLTRSDFEHHLSDDNTFTSLRVLYKHSDSSSTIRKLLLQQQPVLIDLSKTQVIHPSDFVDILCYYANNNLKLPENFVQKYESQLCKKMLEMLDDIDTYGQVIENIYIHFPHLCMYLDASDFVALLNRDNVAPEFIQSVIKELNDEKSSNAMNKLLTICLEEVTNSNFHKALAKNKKLNYQTRICIYDESISPRDNYSPKFKFGDKKRDDFSASVEEAVIAY